MARRLHTQQPDCLQKLEVHLATKQEQSPEVQQAVAEILAKVKARGDAAVLDYTARFDQVTWDAQTMQVSAEEMATAEAACRPEVLEAMELAATRIEAYHAKQKPSDTRYEDATGVQLGWRWQPVEAAGLYVPGGQAAYFSSVLMNALPARAAGVTRLAMTVPAPGGVLHPMVLAAAKRCGIEEIYKIGGAQAIAALAYGTKTIAKVDVIVGPGNAYVAAAKAQVYGQVGIDMIAGPSEILVIADHSANPKWLAADLLSQAEHDTAARSILVTSSKELADAVEAEIEAMLLTLSREETARQSWEAQGCIVVTQSLQEAAEVSNIVAPEHLELAVEDPEALLPAITQAGAIFLGHYTPEAIGDYVAGPSHVLPTAGSARYASGLSVYDFMTRSSLIGCSQAGFEALARATALLAEEEGLDAHARSVTVRQPSGD